MNKEELSKEIFDAGEWQEYYQKCQNSTMETYYTEKYQKLKKIYAKLVEKEEIEKFQQTLEEL